MKHTVRGGCVCASVNLWLPSHVTVVFSHLYVCSKIVFGGFLPWVTHCSCIIVNHPSWPQHFQHSNISCSKQYCLLGKTFVRRGILWASAAVVSMATHISIHQVLTMAYARMCWIRWQRSTGVSRSSISSPFLFLAAWLDCNMLCQHAESKHILKWIMSATCGNSPASRGSVVTLQTKHNKKGSLQ